MSERRDPAEMLADHLVKQINGWAVEWNLDKFTIIGVLEEVKHEVVWESCDFQDNYDDDDDDDEDDD
tara:strand:- start:1128 stop:1328 length:201 start_codon:yes stop_codon:yes gene_type:complete